MDSKLTEKLISYFEKINSVSAVYVFGSQARNDTHERSDIDIAVLFSKSIRNEFDLRIQITEDLKSILNKEIDVCDIREAELPFAYRVLSEGKVIYVSNQAERIDFEVDLMRRYFDIKPFFDEYYSTIAKLAKGGKINARPFTY